MVLYKNDPFWVCFEWNLFFRPHPYLHDVAARQGRFVQKPHRSRDFFDRWGASQFSGAARRTASHGDGVKIVETWDTSGIRGIDIIHMQVVSDWSSLKVHKYTIIYLPAIRHRLLEKWLFTEMILPLTSSCKILWVHIIIILYRYIWFK